jgi:hypothetical protein
VNHTAPCRLLRLRNRPHKSFHIFRVVWRYLKVFSIETLKAVTRSHHSAGFTAQGEKVRQLSSHAATIRKNQPAALLSFGGLDIRFRLGVLCFCLDVWAAS